MYVTTAIIIIAVLFLIAYACAELSEMKTRRGNFSEVSIYLADQLNIILEHGGVVVHVRESTILNDRVEVLSSYEPEWIDRRLYGTTDVVRLKGIIRNLRAIAELADISRANTMLRASKRLEDLLEKYGVSHDF